MASLWVAFFAVVAVATGACYGLVRRGGDDVSEAVDAYREFRAALRPRGEHLRSEVALARERVEGAEGRVRNRHG